MSRRREDLRFLTGTGSYVSDLVLEGDLHAHFVRSPMAHGLIAEVVIDGVPEDVTVLTAADLDLAPIEGGPLSNPGFDRPILASNRVRYVGEPVALVLAQDKAAAVDAAEHVWVDVDFLEVVADPMHARNGPALFEAGNVVRETTTGSLTGAHSEVSVGVVVENQRVAAVALEGLAIRAEPQPDGTLVVQCGHQAPHRFRGQLATQLGVDPGSVRVVVPDVGGAFGLKGMFFPEYVAVAAAALRLGRPVVWVEGRREAFVNGAHGRAQTHTVTLRGNRSGRIESAHIEILADVGAYPHNGVLIPGLSTFVAQGLYDIAAVQVDATVVVTNRAPTGSYRGAGRPEAAYALERAFDAYARAIGMDPAQVRLQNFITPDSLPYSTRTGALYDSGDYGAALMKALEILDIDAVRDQQEQRRAKPDSDPIGVGIGVFVERAGGALGTGEFGSVEVDRDGHILVRSGSASAGQGHETVWADLAAAVFDVDPAEVVVLSGDTGEVDEGVGTFASRSAQVGGSAIHRTASRVSERLRLLASDILEANVDDLTLSGGRVYVIGDPGSGLDFSELATAAAERGERIHAEEMFVPDGQTFPFGAHVAVVEVKRATGEVRILRYVAVDDCGVVLNPMIVGGQVVGSLAQGYGQAVLEGIVYSESGDPLTTSFMDYLIPAAMDTPTFIQARTVSPAPSNPLGVKGTGEAGCIGAPPAIVNAVLDSLAPYGVTQIDMPLRPARVWAAMQAATTKGLRK